MGLFSFLVRPAPKSAESARDRLQILLAHERATLAAGGGVDFLPQLQQEIIAVIRKYVQVTEDRVQVKLDREDNLSVLEVNIELPESAPPPRRRR